MSDKHLSGLMKNLQKDNEEEEEDDQWQLQDGSPQKTSMNQNKNKQQFEDFQQISNPINPMGKVKMNNIKNMSINIFNQFQSPQQAEELIPSLSKLNLNNNKKDLAFNYYFGERQGGGKNDSQPKPQQSKFYDIQQLNKPNFPKEDFIPQQKKPQKAMQMQQQQQDQHQQPLFKNDMINPQRKNMMIDPLLTDHPDIRRKNIINSNTSNVNNNDNPNFNQMQFMQKPHHLKGDLDNQIGYKPNYTQQGNQPQMPTSTSGRFFVIKSIDEDNIVKSINFKIWCSTIKGNQKLQKAFKEADKKYPIYLFFSVNGSGKFMGLAQMVSDVEYRVNFNYWSQNDKWKGFFFINWIYIKDIPNKVFRTILNEFNDNKPVTSSRDTQEIFPPAGLEMLKIFKDYPQESLFLDEMSLEDKMQQQQPNNINLPMNMNMNMGLNQGQQFPHGHGLGQMSNHYSGKQYLGGNIMQNMPLRHQGNQGNNNTRGINANLQQQYHHLNPNPNQHQHQQFMNVNARRKGNNNKMEDYQQFNIHDFDQRSTQSKKIIRPSHKQQQQQQQHQIQFDQGQFPQFDNKKNFFNPPNSNPNQNMMKHSIGGVSPHLGPNNEDKDDEDSEEEGEENDEKDKNKQHQFVMPNQKNQPIFFKPKVDSDTDSNNNK